MSRSKKITELDALLTSENDDVIAIVDTSAETTKKQTKQNFLKEITATLGTFGVITTESSIDGNNLDFVFESKPTVLVVDGATYRETKGWTWNAETLTATISVPAQYDVYGLIFN